MLALEEGDLAARRAELWQMAGEVLGLSHSCCQSALCAGTLALPSATHSLSHCMASSLLPQLLLQGCHSW